MNKSASDYFSRLKQALHDFNTTSADCRATYHSDNRAWKVLVWQVSPALFRKLSTSPVSSTLYHIGTVVIFESGVDYGMIFHCEDVNITSYDTYEEALKDHAMTRLKQIQKSFQ